MSRYDELRDAYRGFHSKSDGLRRDYRGLSADLAQRLISFLGCPAYFIDADRSFPYVSPAPVIMSGGEFELLPFDDDEEIELSDDGRFYFVLCIALEEEPGETPTEAFAVLLSACKTARGMCVRLEDTEPKFVANMANPEDVKDLMGEICGVVEDALSLEPDKRPKPRIGLVTIES